VNRQVERVARLADGWMTIGCTPEQFSASWDAIRAAAAAHGRDPSQLACGMYFNVNLNDDRGRAVAEAKRFLDEYYSADWPEPRVQLWTACGPPEECVTRMRAFAAAGVQNMILRFVSYDQPAQLRRFLNEVAPHL
jgi:alkanesulfonate monooxygenase SsuD/methylene tetrahydromethanopterin reductase-like flavin-dependent oxidoreductase (luciferase family)